jgi:filamentous hemagglutinin
MDNHHSVSFSRRVLSYLISALIAGQPVLPAIGAVVTPSGNTKMDKAGNGVPVVNIATPDGAGISHNRYGEYSVGKEGLILNNATGKLNQTQLGGLIQNNPNLKAGQEARGIINEVTGGKRSELKGYTEVAGKAANVMVANPYGITCDGCGFINTPQATLTTGKPVLNADGSLQALEVTKGSITINGAGLDASQSDAVSIIARATDINAQLHARDLTITAGANRVGADGSVRTIAGDGAAPKVAIDTGALGGMYANRIRLASTESGVGVNLGNLSARAGDITLSSVGKLVLKNSLASGNTTITGTDVTLSGDHKAGGNINVTGQMALTLDQTRVAADKNLQLTTSGRLTQNGGSLTSATDTTLAANSLAQSADAQTGAGRNLSVTVTESAALKGKNVAGQDATVKAKALETGTQLTASRSVSLEASRSAVLNGSVVAGQQLSVRGGALTQRGNISAADISLSGQSLTQDQGAKTNASGNIALSTTGDTSLNGSTVAGKGITVNTGSLNNGGQLAAGTDATVNSGAFSNTGSLQGNSLKVTGTDITSSGSLKSHTTLDISARNATLAGETAAKGNATVTMSGRLDNRGRLVSDNALTLKAAQINNSGTLSGARGLTVTADTLATGAGSVTHSSGNIALNVQATTLVGETRAGGAVTIKGNSLTTAATAQTQGSSLSVAVQNARLDGTQATTGNLLLQVRDTLIHGGRSSAAVLNADSQNITSSGTLQATDALMLTASRTLRHLAQAVIAARTVTLQAADIISGGTIAAQVLNADSQRAENSGILQGHERLTLNTVTLDNLAGGEIVAPVMEINGERLSSAGTLQGDSVSLSATGGITNRGVMAARRLAVGSPEIVNSGLIRGETTLSLISRLLDNRSGGMVYSQGALSLSLPEIRNTGVIASDAGLSLSGARLTNSGELSGASLSLDYDTLNNGADGLLLAQGANRITAQLLTSAGSIAGNTLTLNAGRLESHGLLQGDTALSLTAGILDLLAGSRTLTGGTLALSGTALTTAGQVQGQNVGISARDWQNSGSLLATGSLSAAIAGALNNTGALMSQGDATLNATETDNRGSLLATGNVTLTGNRLRNSGTVQGNRVTVRQDSITNSGTLTGIAALTLASRPEMDAPLLSLVNETSGALLTAGDLSVTAGNISNAGQWQGRRVLIHAQTATNSGAIQAAELLDAQIGNSLTSTSGSKITSNGELALSALTLSNSGQWIAKNLTLKADSLLNSGEITGVEALAVTLNQALNNQASGKMLSAGDLRLSAGSTISAGQLQGKTTSVTTGQMTNSGRLQGESLTLNVAGELNNTTGGVLLSQNAMNVTAATLNNQGTMQGGGESSVKATTRIQNDGRMLSGGRLTVSAPEMTNGSSGLVQAVTLLLDVVNAVNSGRVLASGGAELRGTTLTNSGTLQGADLLLNYRTLSNSGTVFSTTGLTVKGDALTQTGAGRLFSAGNLLLDVRDFTARGQVVALGDATLKLVNTLTNAGTLAAGKTLSVTSKNAVTNSGVMQGNAIVLSADGAFTNNNILTTGNGSSTFSAQNMLLNASGSLQAGGDVQLTSRGNITVSGFTGTAGSLTMTAAGTLLNTALIYAGNNLKLYADCIHNLYGDILAGNSLWMQKNAAGAANTEVINRSGSIETINGDIVIDTAHLLNEADGLTIRQYEKDTPNAVPEKENNYTWYAGDRTPDFEISLEEWKHNGGNVVYYRYEHCAGSGAHGSGQCGDRIDYRLTGEDIRQYVLSESVVEVSATGRSARIAAGRDITLNAGTLDNRASHILAGRNATLTGGTLNNLSAEGGRRTTYVQAEYRCEWFFSDCNDEKWTPLAQHADGDWVWYDKDYGRYGWVPYVLGERTTEFVADGGAYRAVISAGVNVSATFTRDISNTTVTANAGGVSNTISVPSLNTLTPQNIGGGLSAESLTSGGAAGITGPDWRDNLTGGLLDIAGGSSLTSGTGSSRPGGSGDISLYPLPSGDNGYLVPSTDPDSPYLITVNPKLDGLGKVDNSLFDGLYGLLGMQPGQAPRETGQRYTDEKTFLGSAYFLDRLNLKPEKDYRFLGDAAFDTRYVSNAMLNLTGSRYINGLGSDLEQMKYLMDSAASQQKGLGLTFGVALTAEQIARLTGSILWFESTVINGQTVMVPKLYLSPKDITLHNGSVISGNNVQLAAGNITNSAGSITAQNGLSLDASNSISNLNAGLINAGGSLNLSAIGDINNTGSAIAGKTVALESISGSISNITRTQQWDIDTGRTHLSGTDTGPVATIKATDSLSLDAGKDISITGAEVSAGGSLGMFAGNDISIAANQITESDSRQGRKGDVSHGTTTQQGSTVSSGTSLAMVADNNLNVTASSVSAGDSALLSAGNDLNLNAARESNNSRNGKSENHESHAAVSTVTAGDNLTLAAGRDVNSQAAGIAAENNVALQAGRDVNLMAEASNEGNSYISKNKKEINESVRQQGTEIASGGNTTITAGRDITSVASSVTTTGDIALNAGRDVTLTTATESDYHYKETKKKSGGFLSKKTTHTIEEDSATREAGSLLSGNSVTVNAGNNLMVKGSDVVADHDVALSAGNNVDILAATNTDTSWRFKETKKSGLMGTGGIGITIGSSKTTHDRREAGTTQSQSASTVGSTGGNVSITAGNQAHISGSDVIANRDISITGDSVVIDPGHDKRTVDEKFEQKKSGLTVALSGTVGSAINNAVTNAQETKETSDSRLRALQATKTALSGVQAGQAAAMASTTGDPNAMGVSLSLTTQKSKSQQHSESDTVSGSTLNAGNNLSVIATGKNKGDNSGDIVIAGSQLKAGGDTTLDAANDVLLLGAANTQKTTGKNSSSGGGVGVSIGAGGSGAGISIFANVNASKGNEKGNGTEWTETTIDSGKTVTITSGRDTVLSGAQVSGDKITADVGRDLLMSSQQDNNDYDSKQSSVAAGGSFTFGSMTGSGYISASQDKMKSRYDSVQEQTGMFAGDGGFDITVGKHTQLDGAVIASNATADKNHLDTGTLGFSDLHNEVDYKVSHSGISLSGGGSFGGDQFKGNMPGGMVSAGGSSGHAEGTTQAAVADGTITIRDQANQKQDIAGLSRDPEHANDSISPIFDKEKEQNRLQEVGLISDIGSQAADIARTQGELNALNAAKEKYGAPEPGATEEERQAWLEKLQKSPVYKEEMAKYGTGSDIQRGIQAATAALQGLAGGDIGAALAGASAPELAHLLKSTEDNPAVNAIAHAILGGAVAAMQGNNVAAGAAGAATGELVARAIAGMLYPGVKDLSEEQKQTISTLATISAGMAGGIAGDSTLSAATGAQSGKNAVENNYLSTNQSLTFDKELSDCRKSGGDCQAVIDKWKKISDNQSQQLDETLKDNPASALAWDKELAEGGLDMASRPAWMNNIPGAGGMSDEQARAYVQQWNSQDLSKIDAGTPGWMQFAAFASDPENQAALGSLGLLAKEVTTAAVSFMSRNTATATVSAADIGLKWGQGNMKQGMPWEDYVGASLPTDARLPPRFKTFDYYDSATKTAVSAKSLDTQTMSRLNKPNQLYTKIKGNIDAAAKFERYDLSGQFLNSSMITNREIQLAIPAKTTPTQWVEINRAIEYGKSQGVKVTVTQVK